MLLTSRAGDLTRTAISCCSLTRTAISSGSELLASKAWASSGKPARYRALPDPCGDPAVHSDAPWHPRRTGGGSWSCTTSSSGSIAPGPVVALNRAVALAEVEGPGAALALLDGLGPRWLSPFSILIRADLLRRMGWTAEARGRPRAGPSTSRNRILNGAERRLTELLAPISGKE